MQLSKRLLCAAGFVKKGSIAADIGCDHAYLSLYLVKNGICPKVYASDVNDGPLIRADNNVRLNNEQGRIILLKSNGLKDFDHSIHIDCAVICGMGGNLIIDILSDEYVKENRIGQLVLSPQSDIYKVRHFLHDTGYKIVNEEMIYEDGKYYTIINAQTGIQMYGEEYEYVYGKYLIESKNETAYLYLNEKLDKNNAILSSLKCDIINSGRTKERIEEIKLDNQMIEMCLCEYGR